MFSGIADTVFFASRTWFLMQLAEATCGIATSNRDIVVMVILLSSFCIVTLRQLSVCTHLLSCQYCQELLFYFVCPSDTLQHPFALHKLSPLHQTVGRVRQEYSSQEQNGPRNGSQAQGQPPSPGPDVIGSNVYALGKEDTCAQMQTIRLNYKWGWQSSPGTAAIPRA